MSAMKRNPYSIEFICEALHTAGVITDIQAKGLVDNRDFKRLGLAGTPETGGTRVIDALLALNLNRADKDAKLDEETVFRILSKRWEIPFRKIDPLTLDFHLVTTVIPRSFAMKHLILPVSKQDGRLTVATPNPFNAEVLNDIARVCHLKVMPVVSPKTDIIKVINEFFGFRRSIAEAEIQFSGPSVDIGNLEHYVRLKPSEEVPSNDQHIVNAVDHLFNYALDQRASDIHIEPKRDTSLVRMRIDGILHTVYKLPKNVHPAIVSRLKNLSRLDMAEKRKPQDGRIKTAKGDVEVEIRLSTVPVAFGEKVVMRIMDPDILFQDLENLGFSSTDLMRFNKIVRMPHGIILVCGPTGSGKSTTLYSTLRDLSTPDINITTIEDPIEMVQEDFNQIAVRPILGITFGSILRNVLRQDPDIIMVGEMRDVETAENAIQAALTGHLVLSTLHTNDAPTSITRLLDLGIPAFLIQSTLAGVLAQRLVRRICKHCSEPFTMDAKDLNHMGLNLGKRGIVRLHRGRGCERCRGTGYVGRTGIFEVLPYSESLKQMTNAQTDLETIRSRAKEEGMSTLRESAIKKMIKGETTYQEVLRVTWEQI